MQPISDGESFFFSVVELMAVCGVKTSLGLTKVPSCQSQEFWRVRFLAGVRRGRGLAGKGDEIRSVFGVLAFGIGITRSYGLSYGL